MKKPKKWYCDYHSGIRFFDYFSIMILNFPIFVIREYQNDSHSDKQWKTISFGIFGFTFNFMK